MELTPDDRIELAIEHEVEPEEVDGEFVTYPEEVVCQFCGDKFGTENPDALEDE